MHTCSQNRKIDCFTVWLRNVSSLWSHAVFLSSFFSYINNICQSNGSIIVEWITFIMRITLVMTSEMNFHNDHHPIIKWNMYLKNLKWNSSEFGYIYWTASRGLRSNPLDSCCPPCDDFWKTVCPFHGAKCLNSHVMITDLITIGFQCRIQFSILSNAWQTHLLFKSCYCDAENYKRKNIRWHHNMQPYNHHNCLL